MGEDFLLSSDIANTKLITSIVLGIMISIMTALSRGTTLMPHVPRVSVMQFL